MSIQCQLPDKVERPVFSSATDQDFRQFFRLEHNGSQAKRELALKKSGMTCPVAWTRSPALTPDRIQVSMRAGQMMGSSASFALTPTCLHGQS